MARVGNASKPTSPSPANQGTAGTPNTQQPMNQGGMPSMDRGLETTGCDNLCTSITKPGDGTSGDGTTARTPGTFA